MKASHLLGAAFSLFIAAGSFAATTATFNGGADTPVNLQVFGDPGGPSIQPAGGLTGGYLELSGAVNAQHNWATFDRTDIGTSPRADFSFSFKITAPVTPSADGFSFSFANTANYGSVGGVLAPPFTAEDPAATGILGFGFDTWSNNGGQGGFDDPLQPQSSDYHEVSLFYNGAMLNRIDNTRLLATPLFLDDGNWHNVTGSVDFLGGRVSLSVDGQALYNSFAVPGLVPFESRIMFAARTGNENEIAAIDNLNVLWVPEPATAGLGLLAGALLLGRRRR
ncbi:MAG TPA: hypothetical protein VG796_06605 [Verrucomicrobiales bacterium]|nr:hypothetical protein [Verrucomicrobiales bacterium]